MKKLWVISVLIFVFALSDGVAQENASGKNIINMKIPELSLISFEGGEQIVTEASEPDRHVNQIISSPGEETWINYASIVEAGYSNEITVQISAGYLPPDIRLRVIPGEYSGSGQGDIGQPADEIILTDTPKAIITNIGSCYTGKGTNNGHKLSYIYEGLDTNQDIRKNDYDITVTYTIKSSQ